MREMKALTVKMETVTLIGKGRENMACLHIKCMKLIVKCFLLPDFGGGILDLDKYIFPLADLLSWGELSYIRLSCIRVNMVFLV